MFQTVYRTRARSNPRRVQDLGKNGCFLRGELTALRKMVDYLQDG